jgi:hypothetical protein
VGEEYRLRRLLRTWREGGPRLRRRVGLAIAMTLALVVQIFVWLWYIDDAAISFGYARNLANGHGLVAQVGAERVEGYSNPLWVLLLSVWEWIGVDSFLSSKSMGALFAFATLPLVWAITRYARPDRDESVPLLAAVALAANVQFGIWGTSGLENALFNLLLAAAIWRTLVETRVRGFPWSALLFLGIALTRPEGILYAAVGGFAAMAFSLADRRGARPTLLWLAVFFVPFGAYHALRFDYFAWLFPNTYYAKLGDRNAAPFDWDANGWRYMRQFAGLGFRKGALGPGLGHGYLLPLYLLGLLGAAGRRAWLALAFATILLMLPRPIELTALPTLDPGEWLTRAGVLTEASQWHGIRIALLIALAIVAPLGALRRSGGRALALCWGMALVSITFAIGSNGDWMNGFRWMSFLSVPGSVLLAAGIGELRDRVRASPRLPRRSAQRAGAATVLVLFLAYAIPQARHLAWFAWHVPVSASSVKLRVRYIDELMDTLHVEGAVALDVDMGAQVYWARTDMIDMAGLIDVPIARHHFDVEFMKEYVFRERRPDFVHAHGGWEKRTKLGRHEEWERDYLPIAGYLTGHRGLHSGNHIRRDLLFQPAWDGPAHGRVAFENGAVLAGFDLPGLPSAPGLELFVAVGLEAPSRDEAPEELEAANAEPGLAPEEPEAAGAEPAIAAEGPADANAEPDDDAETKTAAYDPKDWFQLEIFLSNESGVVARRIVAPGYGWVAPADWRPGEVFDGRYTIPLPAHLPPGDYDLGFLIRDDQGRVVPAVAPGRLVPRRPGAPLIGGTRGVAARIAAGEVRYPKAVSLAPRRFAFDRNRANLAAAEKLAGELACDGAEARWDRARRRMVHQQEWLDREGPAIRRVLAECWVARAAADGDEGREVRVAWIERARRLDPTAPSLRTTAAEIASGFYEAGIEARGREDWSASYRDFDAAVRADPRLAWARRYAEEARIRRLGLTTPVRAW